MSDPTPSMNPDSPRRMPPARRLPAWLPSRKALLAVAAAFVAGLLLFLALWLDKHDNNDFFRAVEAPRSLEGQVFTPLPVPTPAGEAGKLETEDADEAPAPSAPPPPVRAPVAPAPVSPAAPVPAPAASAESTPRPISTPSPRYPRNAQRRGISGTVLLRVRVGTDGSPERIDVLQGSGSRDLDRAAADGVRRWRFAPAMRNGQPVEADVRVPITFKAD